MCLTKINRRKSKEKTILVTFQFIIIVKKNPKKTRSIFLFDVYLKPFENPERYVK